jgi:CRP-like cAMP-binding protein
MTSDEVRPAGPVSPARPPLHELLSRTLPGCLPDTIEHLLETARIRIVQPGEKIYRQGEPVPVTLLLEGHVVSRRTTEAGKELLCGVGSAGVLFGWSGLAAVPSSVDLAALTECRIGQWAGAEVRALAATDPGLALAAIDSMAWSMHQGVERIEGFIHQDARRRVIRVLAQHRQLFFGESAVLTRRHLPGLVGTTREMTGRVLRQLEREGTIARTGRTSLELLRTDQLEAGAR